VSFFSIGTNDLTQYTLAAERGNPQLASHADGLHPAVLRLIKEVVRVGRRRRRSVSVCGELAGDPVAIPLLLGLGVDCLSVNGEQIPATKDRIRRVDFAAARKLATLALRMRAAEEVRRRAQGLIAGGGT
jgi:phosphocarrier protein FPr